MTHQCYSGDLLESCWIWPRLMTAFWFIVFPLGPDTSAKQPRQTVGAQRDEGTTVHITAIESNSTHWIFINILETPAPIRDNMCAEY